MSLVNVEIQESAYGFKRHLLLQFNDRRVALHFAPHSDTAKDIGRLLVAAGHMLENGDEGISFGLETESARTVSELQQGGLP